MAISLATTMVLNTIMGTDLDGTITGTTIPSRATGMAILTRMAANTTMATQTGTAASTSMATDRMGSIGPSASTDAIANNFGVTHGVDSATSSTLNRDESVADSHNHSGLGPTQVGAPGWRRHHMNRPIRWLHAPRLDVPSEASCVLQTD